jgi:micrococcal nuclease
MPSPTPSAAGHIHPEDTTVNRQTRLTHTRVLMAVVAVLMPMLCGAGAPPAAIGDQVELHAAHQAGVPFHQARRGTNGFQRLPDGTRARVIDVAKHGQWLKLSLPDGRTGWVTSRDVRSSATDRPTEGTTPAAPTPQRIDEGVVERVADGDTRTVITPNHTKLRIRMWGIDAPETPKDAKFPGQPYGPEAEASLKRLVDGKRVRVEIYGVDRYKRLLSTIFIDGQDGNPYTPQYQVAEAAARASKTGMWVLGAQYESPRA